MAHDDAAAELRSEVVRVNDSLTRTASELHDRVTNLERSMTDKIHEVAISLMGVSTQFTGFRAEMLERSKDMPSKSQVRWVMALVAALIVTIAGSAVAVISNLPHQ